MRIILSLICVTLIYSALTFADDASSNVVLQQVNVVVPDRSPKALDQGLQTAFVQQMVKLSGNPKIMATPRMQDAARAVKLWVETYDYVETPPSDLKSPSTLMLQVTFNAKAMQALLDTNGGAAMNSDVLPSDEKSISIIVKNIQDERDFHEVVDALRAIHGVDRVTTKGLQGDQVSIVVSFKGDTSHFENLITDDYRFKTSSTPFEYEWAGREP